MNYTKPTKEELLEILNEKDKLLVVYAIQEMLETAEKAGYHKAIEAQAKAELN